MVQHNSLLDVIKSAAETDKGITFINGETNEKHLSYVELLNNASKTLSIFKDRGIKEGEEVLFQIEDNYDFISIFWACILGGIVPVPVAVNASDEHKLKVFRIWDMLKQPSIICSRKRLEELAVFARRNNLDGCLSRITNRAIYIEEIVLQADTQWEGIRSPKNPDEIAFIQFSSGSTGDPKGVTLTHKNLLTNMEAIISEAKLTPDQSSLSWMPLTHDMGLIGYHLTVMHAGMNQYIMPTSLFIKRPRLWLEKASEHKTSILSSPNFGYQYFLSFFDPEVDYCWDLSHVRLIFNGAEPISERLCLEFVQKLSRYKLRSDTIFPVYGLAEASLAATFPLLNEGIRSVYLDRSSLSVGCKVKRLTQGSEAQGVNFVDLGYPIKNCELRVCGANQGVLDDDFVGYVHIKGDNVTKEYYNQKAATDKLISAEGWLNTGDLGFMSKGRLILTGREKDIIFVNGQNYYAHDIERVAQEVSGIQLGKVAACGSFNQDLGRDEIIVFVLFRKKIQEFMTIAEEIKKVINQKTGLEIDKVIPVKNIAKTTSGKVQRYKLLEKYQAGEFLTLFNEMEALSQENLGENFQEVFKKPYQKELMEIWKEVLKIERLGVQDNFFELGGNSLKAGALSAKVYKRFGVDISVSDIFSIYTIERMAEYLEKAEKGKSHSGWGSIAEEKDYLLSSHQKRIYMLEEMRECHTAYNIPIAFLTEGKLDIGLLESSFKKLIDRHEALRTSFSTVNGVAVQKIHSAVDFKIVYMAVDEGFDVNNPATLEKLIYSFITPFNLRQAPLLRVNVVRLAEDKHLLVLDIHHIAADGYSMGILMQDLMRLYNGQDLNQIKYQYKDYALWQQNEIISGQLKAQEEYWLDKLGGSQPVLDIPLDNPRPQAGSFDGGSIFFEINAALKTGIEALCTRTNATLYMVLAAAYSVLLSKYSGQDEILIGSPIAVRKNVEISSIVGMLTNTIVLKTSPHMKKSFLKFLQEVRQTALEAFDNQEYPFEELVQKLGVKIDANRNPLFDAAFVLQNMDIPEILMNGIRMDYYPFRANTAKFDLCLTASEFGQKICFELQYCSSIFESHKMLSMVNHYTRIVEGIVREPEIKLSDIDILSGDEKDKLLYEFNRTQSNYPFEKTVHQLFEEVVNKMPDEIALVLGEERLTYRELNQKANIIAAHLKGLGVKRDTAVAIMMERSFEMITGAIGILKAGGAYLPIRPDYPGERIQIILEDSQTELLLINSVYSDRNIQNCVSSKVQVIDISSIKFGDKEAVNPENINSSRDLAYIIYTSGTTGKPKGAMVEHRNVVRLMTNDRFLFDFNKNDVWTMFHSFCFDFSVWEMYGALLYGGRLVLVPELTAKDPREFLKLLKKEGVTVLNQTPTAFYNLIDEELKYSNKELIIRYVIFGGETLKPVMLKQWKEKYPQTRLINMYGITETTVHATYKEITDYEIENNVSNIGRPIPTLTAYVLDRAKKLVPIGVKGELYVGGDGVARGYINQAELTKERFLYNPYNNEEIVYKSGDLVRMLSSGEMEYMGRQDHQVKIRGFRIELGEIESALLKEEGVKDAVVTDREDGSGNKYLCAYIVSDRELALTGIRQNLLKKIPDYMVPSYYVRLNKIPMTHNGKVDRNALHGPDKSMNTGVAYSLPENETERILLEIFEELLDIEGISVNDSFMAIGGNSMNAMKLVTKVNERLEVDFPLRRVFELQSIKAMASFISTLDSDKHDLSLKMADKMEHYPVSSGQKQLFYVQQMDEAGILYNMPGIILIHGKLNINALESCFRKIIKRHEAFRTGFGFNGKELVQYVKESVDFSICYSEDFQNSLEDILRCRIRPFDLSRPPLIRVWVVKVSENKFALLCDIHHIISDGVSIDILRKELVRLYSGESLPEVIFQYKDYSVWQNKFNQSKKMQAQIGYWLSVFDKAVPQMDMPADIVDAGAASNEGDLLIYRTAHDLSVKIKEFIDAKRITQYMFFLAVYNILLSQYTCSEDIVVGSFIDLRSFTELENVIGMFVNMVPMRNYPSGDKQFEAFLDEVKHNTLKAYENKSYPFEMLVEQLRKADKVKDGAFVKAVLTLGNLSSRNFRLEAGDVILENYGIQSSEVKFDMIFDVSEEGGGLVYNVEYISTKYSREIIGSMVDNFSKIIQIVLEQPQIYIKDIKLFEDIEINTEDADDFDFN